MCFVSPGWWPQTYFSLGFFKIKTLFPQAGWGHPGGSRARAKLPLATPDTAGKAAGLPGSRKPPAGSPDSVAGLQWRCTSEAPGGGIPSPSRAQEPKIVKNHDFSNFFFDFPNRFLHRSYASPTTWAARG